MAPTDPDSCVDLVLSRRSGYCFHLNGAFGWLMHTMGYSVKRVRAGVQLARDPAPVGATGAHLGLLVTLPDHVAVYCDAGLGNASVDPLPLVSAVSRQGPFAFAMRPSEVVESGWRFDQDPRLQSCHGIDLDTAGVAYDDCSVIHDLLSTDPESVFVQNVIVRRRPQDASMTMRGVVLTRVGEAGPRSSSSTLSRRGAACCRRSSACFSTTCPAWRWLGCTSTSVGHSPGTVPGTPALGCAEDSSDGRGLRQSSCAQATSLALRLIECQSGTKFVSGTRTTGVPDVLGATPRRRPGRSVHTSRRTAAQN